METERSLEAILQDVRRRAKHNSIFNQHHRKYLDLLRDRDWVPGSRLPEAPKVTAVLLRNIWLEQRSTEAGLEYRMTEAGLAELSRPR